LFRIKANRIFTHSKGLSTKDSAQNRKKLTPSLARGDTPCNFRKIF